MKKIQRTRTRANQREGQGKGDAHSLPLRFLSPPLMLLSSVAVAELIASPPFLSSSTRLCFHSGQWWLLQLSLQRDSTFVFLFFRSVLIYGFTLAFLSFYFDLR
ncbi:hypothetical protein PIB30_061194 [Stylosanthes scabra]|uniref:Uncharacterized protein n=1 Tax=Stylosanthes scabra TaxID=79078 RepID=A0ABU6UPF2_9FABA|nr:hypothetical protein [Stylosanthes scabra]